MCHLGNIAVDLPERLAFDPAKQEFTSSKAATARLTREYRAPWSLA
jgi:hypothetical protein